MSSLGTHPGADGRSLRLVWRRWAVVSAGAESRADEPGTLVEPGLTTEVAWEIEDGALVRRETWTAARPVGLRGIRLLIPTTGDRVSTRLEGDRRIDRVEGSEATLEVSAVSDALPFAASLQATGDSVLGKGARGPIPLILRLEAGPSTLGPARPLHWMLRLRVLPRTPDSAGSGKEDDPAS